MVAVPAFWAIKNPLEPSTIATEGFELAHVPPLLPVVNKRPADPEHIEELPMIVPGLVPALTVTV